MREVWKDIPAYEGLYQVSNLGRVKSLKRKAGILSRGVQWMDRTVPEKVLSPSRAGGYATVTLCKSNVKVGYGVHVLVLTSFVGPCPEGMWCRHLNGDSFDNRLSNLCWGTPKENGEDRVRHGTSGKGIPKIKCRGETHPRAKLTEDSVRKMRMLYEEEHTMRDLARMFRVDDSVVSCTVRRLNWKHVK